MKAAERCPAGMRLPRGCRCHTLAGFPNGWAGGHARGRTRRARRWRWLRGLPKRPL